MFFKSFDGKTIFVREWLNVKEPIGIIQIAHGMAEHSERYNKFAEFFNELGYMVVADDHRGHGNTDPDSLGFCEGDMFNDTVKDMASIAKYYRAKYKNLKYVLFGFSYGSFLAQSFIGRYSRYIDGVILGGSSYKKDFEVYLGKLYLTFLGKKSQNIPSEFIEKCSFGAYAKRFDNGVWLSNDEENNEKYYKDPLCAFTCSNNFYKSFFNGLTSLYTKKYVSDLNLKLPVLIISGKNDAVGNFGKGVTKLYEFYKKNQLRNVKLVLIDNSKHEFLNEKKNFKQAISVIYQFLKET